MCFHRKQGSGTYGRWHGPARVIGQEGRSTLWLLHGGVPLTVSAEACRHATGEEALAKRRPVTEPERAQLRSVIGSLGWVTRVCRPDIGYQVHKLQSRMTTATVDDLLAANSLLKYVKDSPNKGTFFAYGAFDFNKATILSFTDASHATDYDVSKSGKPLGYRSQSGRVLALAGEDFVQSGRGQIHILDYHSNIIRRVCRSTLQAETLSMLSGYDDAEHIHRILHGVHGGKPDLIKAMDSHKIVMYTDCRSLEEHTKQAGLHIVGDKRLAINLCALRQDLWRCQGEEVGDPLYLDQPPPEGTTVIQWIQTSTMLADGLTKAMKSPQLHQLMETGYVSVDFDKSRSKKAQRSADADTNWSQKET